MRGTAMRRERDERRRKRRERAGDPWRTSARAHEPAEESAEALAMLPPEERRLREARWRAERKLAREIKNIPRLKTAAA